MGPGTDVAQRLEHGHKPVDHDDFVSLQHDIDYLGASNPIDIYRADFEAISRYKYDFHGLVGKSGLIAKDAFLSPLSQIFFQGNDPRKAEYLRNKYLDRGH